MSNIEKSSDKLPMIEALKNLSDEKIAKALALLPPKFRDLIRLRYGIGVNGGKCYTYAEIGELLGLSAKNNRAYPSQALALAYAKLRNPIRYEDVRAEVVEGNYYG